jgi:hypothetical protein
MVAALASPVGQIVPGEVLVDSPVHTPRGATMRRQAIGFSGLRLPGTNTRGSRFPRIASFWCQVPALDLFRLRVAAAFFADADRSAAGREAEAAPPIRPPFLLDTLLSGTSRPLPDLFPPPVSLLTVAQARDAASFSGTPRDS